MKNDHPGVYVPPPLIYVAFFLFSVVLQNWYPMATLSDNKYASGVGWIIITVALAFIIPALRRFFVSKNTLITIKAASSLQTTGIYAYTRNPMYVGLMLVYCGVAFLKGNLWTFILVPLLTVIIHACVIKKEENYLQRAFGKDYEAYRKRVRRWI